MSTTADVVVIGAGIEGLSTAWQLARNGAGHVVVLERDVIGAGGTGKSSGVVRAHYGVPSLAAMAWKGVRLFETAEEQLGTDVGFEQVGYVVGVSEENRAPLEANVAMQRAIGIDVELGSPGDFAEPLARGRHRRLRRDGLRAAGWLRGRPPHRVLGLRCRRPGVRRRDPPGHRGDVDPHVARRLGGVRRGDVRRCDRDATWSSPPGRGPCRCWPRSASTSPCGPDASSCSSCAPEWNPSPVPCSRTSRSCSTCGSSATATSSSATAITPTRSSPTPTTTRTAPIGRTSSRPRPSSPSGSADFADFDIVTTYSGCYDVTPDYNPVISMSPVEGLFVCAGFSGHGFKISPAVGELMCDLVLETRSLDPLVKEDDFRLSRFADGQLTVSRHTYAGAGQLR